VSTKQEKYFAFYDQLPEPYRTQAKENYDDDFSSDNPRSLRKALTLGFSWGRTSQDADYWNALDTMIYKDELPIEQPKLTDKAFEKECREFWKKVFLDSSSDSVKLSVKLSAMRADGALEEYRKRFGGEDE